jgi:hypothetical protein
MSAQDDILAAIAANLAQPKRARTDAGEVEQHDLQQQIAAAKFAIAMSGAARSPFAALRFAQTVSPNASGAADPATASALFPPPGMAGLPGYPTSGCS